MRNEVKQFAEIMEAQLQANDHKPGWKGDHHMALLERLYEEADELRKCIEGEPTIETWSDAHRHRIASEAADVANFAMMIVDVCEGLKSPVNNDNQDIAGKIVERHMGGGFSRERTESLYRDILVALDDKDDTSGGPRELSAFDWFRIQHHAGEIAWRFVRDTLNHAEETEPSPYKAELAARAEALRAVYSAVRAMPRPDWLPEPDAASEPDENSGKTKADLAAMDCPLPPEPVGYGLRSASGVLPCLYPEEHAARLAAPDGYTPFAVFDRPALFNRPVGPLVKPLRKAVEAIAGECRRVRTGGEGECRLDEPPLSQWCPWCIARAARDEVAQKLGEGDPAEQSNAFMREYELAESREHTRIQSETCVCDDPEPHFVPPSLGEPGFYICKKPEA